MNIYNYIENYGKFTFEEKSLNMVDIVIFSFLSYVDFNKIVGEEKIALGEAAKKHSMFHEENELNIIAIREANKMFKSMKDTKRFKNCKLFNYVYEGTSDIQFSAICIEYLPNKVYVSYEGTDQLISGWKEDLVLTYSFPTISHKKAIKYINKYFTFTNDDLIVGGHSKGGNLALAVAMNANFLAKRHIKEVYNVDGPGLLDKDFNTLKYKMASKKITHIVPDNSVIGMLLNSSNEIVVKTTTIGPITHDIAYWEVEDDHFKSSKLSPYSKNLRKNILKWVNKISNKDLKIIADTFTDVCERANIYSLLDIKKKKRRIISIIKEYHYIDNRTKKLLMDFYIMLFKSFGDTSITEIKSKIKSIIE